MLVVEDSTEIFEAFQRYASVDRRLENSYLSLASMVIMHFISLSNRSLC